VELLAADPAEVENFRAFAKLYGYVRYFHPTDEAASTSWPPLLYDGIDRVHEAESTDDLEQILYDLFLPVAPSLVLERSSSKIETPMLPFKSSTSPGPVVAWQHKGVYLGREWNPYLSVRTGRRDQLPPWLLQALGGNSYLDGTAGAIEHRGREIRLRAAVRSIVEGPANSARLYLTVNGANNQLRFHDEMEDRPITDSQWGQYEIIGEVAEDALNIQFGAMLAGTGGAWFDDFELSVRDPGGEWQPVAITNPGFEDATDELFGWSPYFDPVHLWSLDDFQCFEGDRCARVVTRPLDGPVALFDGVPGLDETISKELGAGLRCTLPLALAAGSGRAPGPERQGVKTLPANDRSVSKQEPDPIWMAAIITTWNVLQHFYPYFDVVDVDWDAELETAIAGTLDAQTEAEFYWVFCRMIAALDDGHGYVQHHRVWYDIGWLPVRAEWIEDRVVVVTSASVLLEPGDAILSIDGVPATDILSNREQYISGSPQWKRYNALSQFGLGPYNSTATLLIDRDGTEMEIELARRWTYGPEDPRPEMIEEIMPGVFYVDLSRAPMSSIAAVIDELAAADGVVFDLRGYPQGNHEVLHHLTDETIRSARWNVPRIIYPDRENIVGWDTSGRWVVEPRAPRFTGHIVFLTDGRAISYAESVMGIVEAYQLGDIVGRPTAGANGNVNPLQLPGNFIVYWTAMKTLKPDGSQHHLIGIQPTHPVQLTIAGVRAGIDEDLEAALALIVD
jgi:hypothetical protein